MGQQLNPKLGTDVASLPPPPSLAPSIHPSLFSLPFTPLVFSIIPLSSDSFLLPLKVLCAVTKYIVI